MNKIKMINDMLELSSIDDSIVIDFVTKKELFAVPILNIVVNKSCKLKIDYNSTFLTKLNINVKVKKGVYLELVEFKKGINYKTKYQYILEEDSLLSLKKFYYLECCKELVEIKLNGINAHIDYEFKTISLNEEKYDMAIFHNAKNTASVIKNNGVNINKGTIIFDISSFVSKHITGCILDQNSRIINLTNNKCVINPNMYIDNNDVIASHSALIGKFSDEEMFYLMSRGINYNDALNMLIKGFIKGNLKDKRIDKIIDNIWR